MAPKILAAVKEKLQKQLKKQLKKHDSRTNTIFIPPEGGDKPNAKEGEKFLLISTAVERLIETDLRSLVLLGDSGMGKTSVSLQFCENLWDLMNNGIPSPIPIYVYLPEYKDYLNKKFLTKVLKKIYLNEAEQETLFEHPLVIVLDGFDEVSIETNLYTSLGFDEADRNIKMLITCRPEGLLHANVTALFELYTNDPDINPFETLYLQPFKSEFIEKYFEAYLKDKYPLGEDIASSSQAQPLTVKIYMEWLDRLPSLKTLVTNPFLLYVTAETLPTIIKKFPIVEEGNYVKPNNNHITQNKLFKKFLKKWFFEQALRVKKNGLLPGLCKEEVAAYMLAYAQNLANSLVGEDGLLNNDPLKEEDCLQPWLVEPIYNGVLLKDYQNKDSQLQQSRFFCATDEKGVLTPAAKENLDAIRSGCLFKTVGNRFQFLHKSITEYLAGQEREKLLSKYCFIVENQLSGEDRNEAPPMVLIKEIGILKSLAETVNENPEFKEFLEELIIKSKEIPGLHIAAANAITILNRAGVDFTDRDFSDIQIPGADLSGGRFLGTNFKGANLSDVNFSHANLMGSQWQGANAERIDFGEKIEIHTTKISTLSYCSPEPGKLHWCIYPSEGAGFYDDKNGKLVTHDSHPLLHPEIDINAQFGTHLHRTSIESQPCLRSRGKYARNWIKENIDDSYDKGSIVFLTASPNGRWIAVGVNSESGEVPNEYLSSIRLYTRNLDSTHINIKFKSAFYEIERLKLSGFVFSPDSQLLAAEISGSYKPIKLGWFESLFTLENKNEDRVNRIYLWRLSDGTTLLDRRDPDPLMEISGTFPTFVSTAKGLWFAYGDKFQIHLMQLSPKKNVTHLREHSDIVTSLAFTDNGHWLASASEDLTIRLWLMPHCESSFVLQQNTKFIYGLNFTPKGDYLASRTQYGEIIHFWRMPDENAEFNDSFFLKTVKMAFSPKNDLLATSTGLLHLRHRSDEKNEIILTLEKNKPCVADEVCFSADGKWLATFTKNFGIILWRMPKGERCYTLKIRSEKILMAFSPDGNYLAFSNEYESVLWSINQNKYRTIIEHYLTHTNNLIAFSQNSALLALCVKASKILLFNTDTAEHIDTLYVSERLSSLAISHSGNWLLCGEERSGKIQPLRISDGKEGPILSGHKDSVRHLVRIHREPSCMASASDDGTVCLWSMTTKLLYTFSFDFRISLLMTDNQYLYVGDHHGFLLSIAIEDPFAADFRPRYCWTVGSSSTLSMKNINITETLNLFENNKALCEQRGSVGIPHIQPSPYQAWCNLFKPIPGTVSKDPSLHQALILVAGKPIHTLTHNSWLVSIVRKRKNPERKGWFDFFNDSSFEGRRHIFFVIEGIKRHRRFIICAELVVNEETNQVQILLQPEENLEKFEKEIVDKVYQANQFEVKAETGETLLRNIQADQQKTIRYNYKGDGGSNSKNTIETHSCVSWCRKHIKGIGFNMDDKWYNFMVTLPGDVALPAEDHGSSSSARAMKKVSS